MNLTNLGEAWDRVGIRPLRLVSPLVVSVLGVLRGEPDSFGGRTIAPAAIGKPYRKE